MKKILIQIQIIIVLVSTLTLSTFAQIKVNNAERTFVGDPTSVAVAQPPK